MPTYNILEKIGYNIKVQREAKAITQDELSEICSLHRNYISSVENGTRNITIKSLEKIANGLNVKMTKLIE